MTSDLVAWGYVLMPALALVVAVPVSALSSPSGLLPLCFPRRWRHSYRQRRARGRQRSARISKRLRDMVLRADRRRCCYCGRRDQLQVDHIIPWSLGGLTCLWNCAVLCGSCNKTKSNYWKSDTGRVYYRPWGGYGSKGRAALILAAERQARRSPWRWLRAYGMLPGW